MYTHAIMNTLIAAEGCSAVMARYDIKAALELLVDAVELARKGGNAQLINACLGAEVKMRHLATALQLARNDMKAIISQLDGSDPEETDA